MRCVNWGRGFRSVLITRCVETVTKRILSVFGKFRPCVDPGDRRLRLATFLGGDLRCQRYQPQITAVLWSSSTSMSELHVASHCHYREVCCDCHLKLSDLAPAVCSSHSD